MNEQNEVIKNKKKKLLLDRIFVVSMLCIPVVHWLVFWLGVNFNSILMAFQIPSGAFTFETMKYMIRSIFMAEDPQMIVAIKNTLIYFLKDTLMIPFQLMIAYFLYKKIYGRKFFQIMFYLPAIVSGVAISTMFKELIMPNGPFGLLLQAVGVENVPLFLSDSRYATGTILFYSVWLSWGGHMLLFGGALARIPTEILESARIDGITTGKEVVFMIVPLVWPTLSTILILNMTGLFTASGPILLFTKGAYGTMTISYWIFDAVAYKGISAYNQVAAGGLIFTMIGAPIVLFVKWLIEKIPTVEY